MNKPNQILLSLLWMLLAAGSSSALACPAVAKVIYYSKSDMKAVEIVRAADGDKRVPAPDMLCVGDRVRVARGVRVTVKYLTNNKLEMDLNGPAELPVTRINLPTQLANSGGLLAEIGKWFSFSDLEPTARMSTRDVCLGGGPITTPLDNGHEAGMPFMLDARLENLHFFWCGGVGPYSVEIIGNDGQVLANQSVSEPSVAVALTGAVPGKTYVMTVRSSDGTNYVKKLLFQKMPATRDAVDPFKSVVHLLCLDTRQNWRLQLWSYLQDQHDSPIRTTVLEHLQAGDM